MDEQKEALKRQIQTQIELLSTMEEGSEGKQRETQVLDKLYRLAIDQAKMEAEAKAAEAERENTYFNREASAAERQHRVWLDRARLGVEIGTFAVSTLIGITTLNCVMKYEETGSFNSKASQMLLRCMYPFRK